MGTWSYFRRLGTSIFWFCNISKFCDYPTLRSTIPDLPGGQGSATRCHLGQPHQKVSSLHRKVTTGPEIGQTRTFLIKDRLYAFKSVKTPKSMQKYTTWQPNAVKMYYKTSSYKETKTTEAKSSNLSTTNTKNSKLWGSRRSSGTSWFKFSSHGKRATQLITQLVKMTHIP